MKRELKFRAWIKYVADPNRRQMYYSNDIDADSWDSKVCYFFDRGYENDEPVMQFTGLKDKYGKDIYEGDIVAFTRFVGNYQIPNSHHEIRTEHTVTWEKDRCRFGLSVPNDSQKLREHPGYVYEVIGNIYETPELLK